MSWPLDKESCSTENWTSASGEFHQHLFRNIVPDSSWTVFFDRVPFLLRTGSNEWPLSYTKLLRKCGDDLSIRQTFFFIVSCSTRNVVEHQHKDFFLWNFLVFLSICKVNFWLSRWAATYWILGRCSTRIPSALHQFYQIHPNLYSHASFDSGFCGIFLRHNTESRALKIDDSFVTN